MISIHKYNRAVTVAAFSCLLAYLLSFVFEGQVLYSTVEAYNTRSNTYIIVAIIAHFVGLFSCGFFIKTIIMSKYTMIIGMAVCLIATLPFLFVPSVLWFVGLVTAGYAGGCAVVAWSFLLKRFTPKNERIKSCADVLIFSNIIMIAINVITINLSHTLGVFFSMLCLALGIASSLNTKEGAAFSDSLYWHGHDYRRLHYLHAAWPRGCGLSDCRYSDAGCLRNL